MSRDSGPYYANQRPLWMRHDAHLWIRHDFKRFLAPGTDPADVIPALRWRRDREDAALAAEIERGYRLIATLRAEVASIGADMVRRRLAEQTKYSPAQPRVPGGNPRGGQWTDRGGGGGGFGVTLGADGGEGQDADLTLPMGDVDIGDVSGSSELGDLFQIKPDKTRVVGEQIAGERQGGYPIDLLEERERGGHAIEGHIRSDRSIESDLEARVAEAVRKGDFVDDMRQGSFTSLESANKLVNSTIARNPEQVDRVVNGGSPQEKLDADFPTPTGREAVARTERSQIFIRDTYWVRVVIVPDGTVAKGFRVETAFPMNRKR